jgi:hypothetical protein
VGDAHIVNGFAGQSQRLYMVSNAAPKNRQVGGDIKTVDLQS